MKKLIIICLLVTAQIGYGAADDFKLNHRAAAIKIGTTLENAPRYGMIDGSQYADLIRIYIKSWDNRDMKSVDLASAALKSINIPFDKVYFNETGHNAIREKSEPATHLFDKYYSGDYYRGD